MGKALRLTEKGNGAYQQRVGSWAEGVGDTVDDESDIWHVAEVGTLHSVLRQSTGTYSETVHLPGEGWTLLLLSPPHPTHLPIHGRCSNGLLQLLDLVGRASDEGGPCVHNGLAALRAECHSVSHLDSEGKGIVISPASPGSRVL